MSVNELSELAFSSIAKEDTNAAINYLEEILNRFGDHQNIDRYKMLLAELYFKDKSYAAAQEVYEHFNQFYPADKRAEYSKYKSMLSMFHQTRQADCDQTKTQDTIQLCHEYLKNPKFNRYRNDVLAKKTICENRLLDKELYVFNFYLKHGNYDAARNRLKYINEKHLAANDDLKARVLYHEYKLAQKEKKFDEAKQHVDVLSKEYPTSSFTQMAQAVKVRRPFIF